MFPINTLFNVLNLMTRIGLIIFVIKKYVIPYLQRAMSLQQQDLEFLEKKHVGFKNDCKELEQNLFNQEIFYNDLHEKFGIWQNKIAQMDLISAQKCQELEKKAAEKYLLQQTFLEQQKIIQQQLPTILSESMTNLHEKFDNNQDLALQYRAKILSIISKDVA